VSGSEPSSSELAPSEHPPSEHPPSLTTTSFAILGFLAIQPWTTYALAIQMERTLNRYWPRARSRLYEEPKKLVAHGLAIATKETVGRRPRTVYTITAKGRAALAEWLKTPGSGPSLEFEQLTKLFFADHGSKDDALATLAATRAWAADQLDDFTQVASDYVAGHGPFPERAAINAVGARFMVDFYEMVDSWADWAAGVVAQWPDDLSRVEPTLDVAREIIRRAERRASRTEGRRPEQGGDGKPKSESVGLATH
jgi:PadR family transcriptional regulator AphA